MFYAPNKNFSYYTPTSPQQRPLFVSPLWRGSTVCASGAHDPATPSGMSCPYLVNMMSPVT